MLSVQAWVRATMLAALASFALAGAAPGSAWAQMNPCPWLNDGECDEPDIGTGLCALGTDVDDCRPLREGGNDSCEWANNGVCDEPYIGTGACADGTDRTDCLALYPRRHADNSCVTAFNNLCEEPGYANSPGTCAPRTDTVDCLGRDVPAGAYDHYFGRDDRIRIDTSRYPWSAVGRLIYEDPGMSCTGALIAADIVLTAAHCLYDEATRTLPILFLAGQQGKDYRAASGVVGGEPAPRYDPQLHATTDRVNDLDWALLFLTDPIGQEVGWFEIFEFRQEDLDAIQAGQWFAVYQAGYSADSLLYPTGHIGCTLEKVQGDRTILHRCDTTHGDSGSPIWILRGTRAEIIAVDSAFQLLAGNPAGNRAVDSRSFFPYVEAVLAKGR